MREYLFLCVLVLSLGLSQEKTDSASYTRTSHSKPNTKKAITVTRYDDQEIDEFGVNKKPFYLPEDSLNDYTVTETFITTETIKTSRIINLGTSTTITKSLTLSSTTTLTSTFLDVSVKFATTNVELTLTVDGGLKTSTTFIDTTTLVTVTVTPVAGTILNLVTKYSRTTATTYLTVYDTVTTPSTVLVTETLVVPSFSLVFVYAATETLAVPIYQIITVTEARSFLAYTSTSTPPGFGVSSASYTSAVTFSTTYMATLGPTNYATTFNVVGYTPIGTLLNRSTVTILATDMFDVTAKTITTFTIA